MTGGTGAGIAASSTAGNAAIVPMAVAAIYAGYKPIAAIATVQVSAAVVVTAILTPVVTARYAQATSHRLTPKLRNSAEPV